MQKNSSLGVTFLFCICCARERELMAKNKSCHTCTVQESYVEDIYLYRILDEAAIYTNRISYTTGQSLIKACKMLFSNFLIKRKKNLFSTHTTEWITFVRLRNYTSTISQLRVYCTGKMVSAHHLETIQLRFVWEVGG